MSVTIYHNPRCSKSRQTLQILQDKGIEPTVVEYLKTPLDKAALQNLLAQLGCSPREILRKGEEAYKENHLHDPNLTDDQLLNVLVAHPKLMERPVVVHGERAVLGRPPESVLALFP
ncbi:arsenate reductase [Magnetococcus marinus MC-1]|uniref:Arsenate reductase n=1 Tax=Magnetococcus marinus (strain ATCC BAA-1437 / JCM 17883 / MC-1) TaxID=156889 RepID=A0L4C0_MAGMM|nr:arsenate reductase (glutaredoxin) [Magnetococcus marinus]ABK42813.1 arsenate reductase [Magnetococcus marinus MC-1]